MPVLRRLHALLHPGGWVAVKVPNAPAQRIKERLRARVQRGYRPALADNLVHVNHFSPGSLRLALERAGFTAIAIDPAAPELSERGALDRAVRLSAFAAARVLPGALHTPLALNLQAYGRRD
jgi:hypothetical protein